MKPLIASPPETAIGGVATYSALLVAAVPGARAFDQWWPLRDRAAGRLARLAVHALGLARWWAVLALRRPGVVHLQVTAPGIQRDLLYARAARRLGIPIVAHLHTSRFAGAVVEPLARRYFPALLTTVDAVVVMSEAAAADLAAAYPEARPLVHVLPNPVPLPPAQARAATPNPVPRVLCVGVIDHNKNQLGLVAALDAATAQGVPWELELVGPWGDLDVEERRALERHEHVTLTGPLRGPRLHDAFARCDVYALFSNSEAEPLSLLEAMAHGLPVVGTATGSVPTLVAAPGPGNAVVAPGDVPGLTAALVALLRDPVARTSAGERNREWVAAERSMAGHVTALTGIYTQLVGA